VTCRWRGGIGSVEVLPVSVGWTDLERWREFN